MIHPSIRTVAASAVLIITAELATFAQPTAVQSVARAAAKPLPFVRPIFGDNMVLSPRQA